MANRDIVVLNTTASRLEVLQTTDELRLSGVSNKILTVEDGTGTEVFAVNPQSSSINVSGDLLFDSNISSSLDVTSSFSHIEATNFGGSAALLTNTDRNTGIISGSSQIANEISGSIKGGATLTGNISGAFGLAASASFGLIIGSAMSGNAKELRNKFGGLILSQSAQIADEISGSFKDGFEFVGSVSGSSTSTGSFGKVIATTFSGDGSSLTNVDFGLNLVSSSQQIADNISGSFQKGFAFTGNISGSSITTGSFQKITATKVVGNVSSMENLTKSGLVSSSAQIEKDMIGLAQKGFHLRQSTTFEPQSGCGRLNAGLIGGHFAHHVVASRIHKGAGGGSGRNNAVLYTAHSTNNSSEGSNCHEHWNGISWSEQTGKNYAADSIINMTIGGGQGGTVTVGGGATQNNISEEWDGTTWSGNRYVGLGGYSGGSGGAGVVADAAILPGVICCVRCYPPTLTTEARSAPAHPGYLDEAIPNNMLKDPLFSTAVPANCAVHHYNGVTCEFSIGGFLMAPLSSAGGGGLANAAFNTGNDTLCSPEHFEYDGNAWSYRANGLTCFNTDRRHGGSVNDIVAMGGRRFNHHYDNTVTEAYDGTSWHIAEPYPLVRGGRGNGGGADSGFHTLTTGGEGKEGVITERSFFTASIGLVEVIDDLRADGNALTSSLHSNIGLISSSAQIADDISGSFIDGVTFGEDYGPRSYGGITSVSASLIRPANVWSIEPGADIFGAPRCPTSTGGYTEAGTKFAGGIWAQRVGHFNWDGTAWAEVGTKESSELRARSLENCEAGMHFWPANDTRQGIGTQNNAMDVGFSNSTNTGARDIYSIWDGLSWNVKGHHNMEPYGNNSNSYRRVGSGFADSAIFTGCRASASSDQASAIYNGISWDFGGSTSSPRQWHHMAAGHENDAIVYGGVGSAGNSSVQHEQYNGTSWASGPNAGGNNSAQAYGHHGSTNSSTRTLGGGGCTGNDSIIFGGCAPFQYSTERFDGTAWSYVGSTLLSYGNYQSTNHEFGGRAGSVMAMGNNEPGNCNQSFDGEITTGSFGRVDVVGIKGSVVQMDNLFTTGEVSSSKQIADNISGSFNRGFEFTGTIGQNLASWTAGANLLTSMGFGAYVGDTEVGIAFGGTPGLDPAHDVTQIYNGTVWCSAQPMGQARLRLGGAGTVDTAVAIGGSTWPGTCYTNTEIFDGCSWSEVNDISTAMRCATAAGNYTSVIAADGGSPYNVEHFNGTSWASGTDHTYTFNEGQLAGTQNSAHAVGQQETVHPDRAEGHIAVDGLLDDCTCHNGLIGFSRIYDGTTWNAGASYGLFAQSMAMSGRTENDVAIGGGLNANQCHHQYDGTTWSNRHSMISEVYRHAMDGTGTSQIIAGGYSNKTTVYHFNCVKLTTTGSFVSVETPTSASLNTDITFNNGMDIEQNATLPKWNFSLPPTGSAGELFLSGSHDGVKMFFTFGGAWSMGGNLLNTTNAFTHNGARGGSVGAGLANAGSWVEEYDGSVWSSGTSFPSGNTTEGMGIGTVNAHHSTNLVNSFNGIYDGSSWSVVNASGAPDECAGDAAGTQNASVWASGYYSPSRTTDVEEFDGSSYSEASSVPAGWYRGFGHGTQNAAHMGGGYSGYTATYTYNGSAWSSGTAAIAGGTHMLGSTGTTNDGFLFGGGTGTTHTTHTQRWDGSSWKMGEPNVVPNIGAVGAGTTQEALAAGSAGQAVPTSTANPTEEFHGAICTICF